MEIDYNWISGDIVYWMHKDGWWPCVHWGIIENSFFDGLEVSYLELYERRRVNGIPIDAFESEERYKKLPKGWTYNTSLYQITYDDLPEDFHGLINIQDPSSLIEAYNKGYLVKSSSIFHGEIKEDITKEGYRILKTYPIWYMSNHKKPDNAFVPYFKACKTFEQAKNQCLSELAEFKRQSELSDYDWSLEKIDKTLSRYQKLYLVSDESIKLIRDRLLNKDHLEDIETRIYDNHFQWKYWKNKKWLPIED